jgi:hypothetical protein
MSHMTRSVFAAILCAGLASPALAQSTGTWNGLPDRFQIDSGDYRIDADTVLRLNGSGIAGSEVDRHAGLGVQYKYNNYSYDRSLVVNTLGGEITYQGFQGLLSFVF